MPLLQRAWYGRAHDACLELVFAHGNSPRPRSPRPRPQPLPRSIRPRPPPQPLALFIFDTAALVQLLKDAVDRDWPTDAAKLVAPLSPLTSRALLDAPAIGALLAVPSSVEPLWVLEELDGLIAICNLAFFLLARESAGRQNLVRFESGRRGKAGEERRAGRRGGEEAPAQRP